MRGGGLVAKVGVSQNEQKIIECVPNFSEGRDRKKIAAIVASAKRIKGVKVLNIDSNADYNRTVLTFAGEPQAVKKAAFGVIKKATELIDMQSHWGEHPRIGACDVCPFVPIAGATMEDCIELAKELGKEVAESLKISVYLYEEAAKKSARKNLAAIRAGEYEGLAEKLQNPKWKPDYGSAVFCGKSGAVVIGARNPLIAFNVNLETKDKSIADNIAGIVRESGWRVVSPEGKTLMVPGVFKKVKAIGVCLEERGICQVSMNLTDYRITPPHLVYETIKKIAQGLVLVKGSEIVGLVPREAILMAGRFYSPSNNSEESLITDAALGMGLDVFKRFEPKEKIIEYLI